MSWAVGYDDNWNRDIGYGVLAYCDHPDCDAEINRGLGHVCCNSEPWGGENGCGRYFCSEHESPDWSKADERTCGHYDVPWDYISSDHPDWIDWKLNDESWQQWRKDNVEWVGAHDGRAHG